MSHDNIAEDLPENDPAGMNFNETELTLGFPGEPRLQKSGVKRGFSKTVYLNLGGTSIDDAGHDNKYSHDAEFNIEVSNGMKPPMKAQAVGWPPVRSLRKNMMKSCKYVKVAVDGAPYLRKVDLEMYSSYQELQNALENMFSCLTLCNHDMDSSGNILSERKLMDPSNGVEYVPTYEDRDGDWMLAGDVPWKMFVESCKKLRLMKRSEAIGLAPRALSKSSSTNTC